MFTRPEAIGDDDIVRALREGWDIDADGVDYLPVGFGSHHWLASTPDGSQHFVTVDDLAERDLLGATAADAFDGLNRAFATVRRLHDTGMVFVVAPVAGTGGEVVRWLDDRHSIALFPYVGGTTEAEYGTADEPAAVVDLLVALHTGTEHVRAVARAETLDLPNRRALVVAVAERERLWTGGPFAEPARALLRQHLPSVRSRLAEYDRLAAAALRDRSDWVVTHGEPHSRNVLRTDAGMRLIDWDTVLIGPPERDLWMLVDHADEPLARRYADATGRPVSGERLQLFRLWWDLCEIGGYVGSLRAPHTETEDSAAYLRSLAYYVDPGGRAGS